MRHRVRGTLVALLTGLGLALLAPAGAAAAPGDLSFGGCASDAGTPGVCDNLPGSSFDQPTAVTATARDVFALAQTSRTINRLTTGLGFTSCIANAVTAGTCTDFGTPLFAPPEDVAATPDGRTIYVSGAADDALTLFRVRDDGVLDYGGCFSQTGTGGACTNIPGGAFDAPASVAVSPDGKSLYVAARLSFSVTHFSIAADGALTFQGCVSNDGSGGDCSDIPGSILGTPAGLALSPDGSALFVSASLSDAVTRLSLDSIGRMTFASCVSSVATGTCTDLPGSVLLQPTGLAVAPDGRSLQVAALSSNSLVSLAINPASLDFAGCSSQTGSMGTCTDLPDVFMGPRAVAIGAGGNAYVVAQNSDSMARFDIGASGVATFNSCLSDTGSGGVCGDVPGTGTFDRPNDLALAPDGSSLYVAAADSDSVVRFARKLPDTTPPGLTVKVKKKGKAGKPISVTITCDEACSANVIGTAKPKGGKKRKLPPQGASLAAEQQVKLKLKPKGKLKRTLKKAGKGKVALTVTAIDEAGNLAEAKAKQKLK